MRVRLVRIVADLPRDFDALHADAKADGHRHLERLAVEFAETPEMYHAIYAAYVDGQLAGIGAATDEPALPAQPVWRMRRYYAHRQFRGQAIARMIAEALLDDAVEHVTRVTVHAGNEGAIRFWEALQFTAVSGQAWSHERALSGHMT